MNDEEIGTSLVYTWRGEPPVVIRGVMGDDETRKEASASLLCVYGISS